jgi:hypothetical protein
VRPVGLHLHPYGSREASPEPLDGRAGDFFDAPAHARRGGGARRERRAVDELHGAPGVQHARDQHLVDPLLALERGHARHALAVRHAEPVEVGVLLEGLGDALAQVALDDVGGVARHVVVRVEGVELDGAELEPWLLPARANLREACAVPQGLRRRERAVDEPPPVAALDDEGRGRRREGEGLGGQAFRLDGEPHHEAARPSRVEAHLVAAVRERLPEPARGVARLRRGGVVLDGDALGGGGAGRGERREHRHRPGPGHGAYLR